MREINGYKVRGLTRKEVRGLKEYGFYNSFYVPPLQDPDKVDEGVEVVLGMCVEDLPDDLPNKHYIELFQKGVMVETYGSREEEKNLPMSGNGSQTKSG